MARSGLTFAFYPDHALPLGDWIWVYECVLGGKYNKGNARIAQSQFGASKSVDRGPSGKAYAIPCSTDAAILPASEIQSAVDEFIAYAASEPSTSFFVTKVGTEKAGFTDSFMAHLFALAPFNVSLPMAWKPAVMAARQISLFQEISE